MSLPSIPLDPKLLASSPNSGPVHSEQCPLSVPLRVPPHIFMTLGSYEASLELGTSVVPHRVEMVQIMRNRCTSRLWM